MEASRLLDGLLALDGCILPSTSISTRTEGQPIEPFAAPYCPAGVTKQDRSACEHQPTHVNAHLFNMTPDQPLPAVGSLQPPAAQHPAGTSTLAFFLQLPATVTAPPHQVLTAVAAAVLPQTQPQLQAHQLTFPRFPTSELPLAPTERQVLRLSTGPPALGTPSDSPCWDPSALRKVVLLLTFNSPAATQAALARLHAVALASHGGRAALAALHPVPLVAGVFARAVARRDFLGGEQAAVVLLALLDTAQMPLTEDVAGQVLIPAAVDLLGGRDASAASAAAAIAATAAAADAKGTISNSRIYMHLQTRLPGPTAAATAAAAGWPCGAYVAAAAIPVSSRLAAACLLLHLASSRQRVAAETAVSSSKLLAGPGYHSSTGPGSGAICDLLVAAGALEACCEALSVSFEATLTASKLQCRTLQLMAVLTEDGTGWPWQWPVVRAAAVDGCARHAVALLQLLDGGGGIGGATLFGMDPTVESEAHDAARRVVVHLSRGPLLVREALVRAGALSPVVEAIMMWPPPSLWPQASALSTSSCLHFAVCLGVLLQLSVLPQVRQALSSPALRPLLSHLLGLLENQPWEGGRGGGQTSHPHSHHLGSGDGAGHMTAVGPLTDIREALLELFLNLALDPCCHPGLTALEVEPLLVRGIAASQQVKLDTGIKTVAAAVPLPEPYYGFKAQPQPQPQQSEQHYQQPWRAAAGLRLMAALAADSRFSVPQPSMQMGLAAVGGLDVVAHEVTTAAAALPFAGAAVAYDLAVTALCALLTANHELQQRVVAMPELMMTLSAALRNPVVTRSDTLLRVTLAAWQLITAQLANPGADPASAHNLLLSLGHNPLSMHGLNVFGGRGGRTGSLSLVMDDCTPPVLVAAVPPGHPDRTSGLLAEVEVHGRLGSTRNFVLHATAATAPGAPEAEQRSVSDAAGSASGEGAGAGAGAGIPPPPVSARPLFPVTPLPGPVPEGPDVTPLRPLSCVIVPGAGAGVGAEDSRPSSGKNGPARGGSSWTEYKSRCSRSPGHSLESLAGKPLPPRRAVFMSPDSDNDNDYVDFLSADGAGAVDRPLPHAIGGTGCEAALSSPTSALPGRSTSHRLAATPFISPSARQVEPPSVLLLHPQSWSSSASPPTLLHLPGALEEEVTSSHDLNSRSSHPYVPPTYHPGAPASALSSAAGCRSDQAVRAGGGGPGRDQAREETDDLKPHTPLAIPAGPRPSSSKAYGCGARLSPVPLSVSSFSSAASATEEAISRKSRGGSVTAGGEAAAWDVPSPFSDVDAQEVVVGGPSVELAPPLQCLVSHLQALLGRSSFQAVAALVLVQLARLEVVRGSAVMAAGWGSLMEAVTSSLTRRTEQTGSDFVNSTALRAASATASAGPPTEPRDKLALLEVMAVAAGSAAEGRAALTRPSVVGVLVDLACGRGDLAASLGVREEPVVHSVGDGPGGGTTQFRLRVLRKLQWLQLRVLCRGGVSGGGGGSADAAWLLHQQLQQPYLTRGRTLAMEVMAQLLQQRHVAELMQEKSVGAVLAEEQLLALALAAEAVESIPSAHGTSPASAAAFPSSSSVGLAVGEQRRQRNAAARLLLRLGEHVSCAMEFLIRPGVLSALIDLVSDLWDSHVALIPVASSAPAARTEYTPSTSLGPTRTSRGPGPGAALSTFEANGGISASTSDSNLNLNLNHLLLANHRRYAQQQPEGPTPRVTGSGLAPPSMLPSPLSRPSPLFSITLQQMAATEAADAPGTIRRSATAGSGTLSALGPVGGEGGGGLVRGMSGSQQPNLLRAQSPMLLSCSRSGRGIGTPGGAPPSGMAPHPVATRMSLHAAVCTETTQWTTPAQRAMKALEMSEESQQPAVGPPDVPYYRHAHTHTGTLMTMRPSPLSAGSLPVQPHGVGGGGGGQDAGSDSDELMSPEDSITMLEAVAPPPRKPPPPPQPSAPKGLIRPPQPHLRSRGVGAGGNRNGRMSEVALTAELMGRGRGGGGGAINGGAGEEEGGDEEGGDEAHSLVCNTVLRRGTRALAPLMAPGMTLPSGTASAPRRAAAQSAASCACDVLQLLQLLAEADANAARAMSTLPTVELLLDLTASTSAPLVLAALGLLEKLAGRQDAHETFWDCNAVAQLVALIQSRSAVAAAAAAAAAAAEPFAHRLSGDRLGTPATGGGVRDASAAAAAAQAASTAAHLQLAAARVLERLCKDPDLHGRLAATELPAALMALVRRYADSAGGQLRSQSLERRMQRPGTSSLAPLGGFYGIGGGGALTMGFPFPISKALLTCVLGALASLLDCADVRRQARERRLPLHLGVLAAGPGEWVGSGSLVSGEEPGVASLAARCGEKLRDEAAVLRPHTRGSAPA